MIGEAASIDVVQLGARMHYAVPRILHERERLGELFTDFYLKPENLLTRLVDAAPASGVLRRAKRRRCYALDDARVRTFPLIGVQAGLRYSFAQTQVEYLDACIATAKAMARAVTESLRTDRSRADAVYAFNTAAKELFESSAWERRILEQTILPYDIVRSVMSAEDSKWPEWSLRKIEAEPHVTSQREAQEWRLADCILVGSHSVKEGLQQLNVPSNKINVVPYGIDVTKTPRRRSRERADKLRVLFAGEIGLRKGAPYLLEAVRRIPHMVDVRLLGAINVRPEVLARYRGVADIRGPVAVQDMRENYAWADLFILPSLSEGSATVIYEALAAGLPVIASQYSGAVDLPQVRLLPEVSVDGVEEALRFAFYDRPATTEAEVSSALDLVSYEAYSERLTSALRMNNTVTTI